MLANLVRRGSQTRQRIEDSEYEVVRWIDGRKVILRDKDNGREELYVENDHFAGFVVVIINKGDE